MAGPSRTTHEPPSAAVPPAGVRVLSVERGSLGARIGVRPGDRVALAMRNYPEWVFGYWATISIGASSW